MTKGRRKGNPYRMTNRQIEILGLMSEGRSNEDMSLRLEITTNTVSSHISAIFKKMNAYDRGHAVALAYQAGLLGDDESAQDDPIEVVAARLYAHVYHGDLAPDSLAEFAREPRELRAQMRNMARAAFNRPGDEA